MCSCKRAVSADGRLRTLVLSVEDKVSFKAGRLQVASTEMLTSSILFRGACWMQVVFLEGRTMHRKQERPRWADAYNGDSFCVAI